MGQQRWPRYRAVTVNIFKPKAHSQTEFCSWLGPGRTGNISAALLSTTLSSFQRERMRTIRYQVWSLARCLCISQSLYPAPAFLRAPVWILDPGQNTDTRRWKGTRRGHIHTRTGNKIMLLELLDPNRTEEEEEEEIMRTIRDQASSFVVWFSMLMSTEAADTKKKTVSKEGWVPNRTGGSAIKRSMEPTTQSSADHPLPIDPQYLGHHTSPSQIYCWSILVCVHGNSVQRLGISSVKACFHEILWLAPEPNGLPAIAEDSK
ncbi:hypothetical protein C8R46DRAFT_1031604 [Mycena filopes]|nr:hypothetical protein C8R46DRAFT_1031604 [Mycena filopes]